MAAVVTELRGALTNAKLEKIGQPERDEVHLTFRAGGEVKKLLLSASSACPRLCLTQTVKENPGTPPFFCTLLRKHLAGAVLREISQPGFERAAILRFAARDEMGFPTERTLIIEVLGKFSNLIFTDGEGKILGVLHPVDFSQSEKRQLLAGMRYELPPPQDKLDPRTADRAAFMAAVSRGGMDKAADKAIVAGFLGIAPSTARELVFEAAGAPSLPLCECRDEKLWQAFSAYAAMLREERFAPAVITRDGAAEEEAIEFACLPLRYYGSDCRIRSMSASECLEYYYRRRAESETVREKAKDILRILQAAESRVARKIAAREDELAACAEKDKYKNEADLLKANLHLLRKGDTTVTVTDYYADPPRTLTITLDPRYSPAELVRRGYKKYAKLKTAETVLREQLALAREEQAYLRTVAEALRKAEGRQDLDEIRAELSHCRYKLTPGGKGKREGKLSKKDYAPKTVRPREPMEFRTSGGYTVYCGRNNLQNDYLSFHLAGKDDWWFHAKNAPGSHVVLVTTGLDEPPAADFTEAATIAASYSDLEGSGVTESGGSVQVDYTKVKELRKPVGANPGAVIYHKNYAAFVRPDRALCERLRVKGGGK